MATFNQLADFHTEISESSVDGKVMIVNNPSWGLSSSHPINDPDTGIPWKFAVLELELLSVLVEMRLTELNE